MKNNIIAYYTFVYLFIDSWKKVNKNRKVGYPKVIYTLEEVSIFAEGYIF